MANVLFLRAPSGSDDRYEKTFQEAGYTPISVPVLETVTTNLSDLQSIITAGPQSAHLDGVIVTSARSCESWKNAVNKILSSSSSGTFTAGNWRSTTFYVVGEATASALRNISKAHEETPYDPVVILGESTGTGEKLAHYILDQPGERPKKLLYLTGDKNKDTLPSILGGAGIELQSLKVYETQGSSSFERDLVSALNSIEQGRDGWWITHFAPSAADFVTPILTRIMHPNQYRARIAAIGPVTAKHLEESLGLHVDVVSPKPSPQELLNCIRAKESE